MLKDIRAGLVSSIISLSTALSTGALVFQGPYEKYLGLGITAAIIGATVQAIVTSLGSGFKIGIGAPSNTVAAPLAASLALFYPHFGRASDLQIETFTFMFIAIYGIATGATMLLLGIWRLGNIVRFIPFPVVAGFLAIAASYFVKGALLLTAGALPSLRTLPGYFGTDHIIGLALAAGWALILKSLDLKFKNPAVLSLAVFLSVIVIQIVNHVFGNSRIDGQTLTALLHGLMFHLDPVTGWHAPFSASAFSRDNARWLWAMAPELLGLIFIAVLATMLAISGLEAALGVECDLDRELKVQGLANATSGFLGGTIGLLVSNQTIAVHALGASRRLVGLVTGLVCFAALFGATIFINDVPRFVIAGLLLQLSIGNLWRWCILTFKRLPFLEWLMIPVMLGVAVFIGFVPAIVTGLLGGCIIFIMDSGRVNVVRRTYGLDEHSSPLVRSQAEMALLRRDGAHAKVMELRGFMFFGTAHLLFQTIKKIATTGSIRIITLDFTAVTGCDASSTMVLARIASFLDERSIQLVLTGLQQEFTSRFTAAGLFTTKLRNISERHLALEYAEDLILERAQAIRPATLSLKQWLTTCLGQDALATALMPWLRPDSIAKGEFICRQGEPTDTLLFIEAGRVAVVVDSGAQALSVRVFGPHTIAGEQGFILQQPRAASLRVEQDAQVWTLSRTDYDTILATNTALAFALLQNIVLVQAERLGFATRQNGKPPTSAALRMLVLFC